MAAEADDHFARIYAERATDYQRLISREDHEGRILPALADVCPFDGVDVVELGAGTGRLTVPLAPRVRRLWAFDAAPAMLGVAARRLGRSPRCALAVAEHRSLPLVAACADVVLSAWAVGHLVHAAAEAWHEELDRLLDEVGRVLRPGGVFLLLETLGTGRTSPRPPDPRLAAFYGRLEQQLGFDHRWIRTDYRFDSPAEADELTRFFFGDELADRTAGSCDLPECTGLWWRSF